MGFGAGTSGADAESAVVDVETPDAAGADSAFAETPDRTKPVQSVATTSAAARTDYCFLIHFISIASFFEFLKRRTGRPLRTLRSAAKVGQDGGGCSSYKTVTKVSLMILFMNYNQKIRKVKKNSSNFAKSTIFSKIFRCLSVKIRNRSGRYFREIILNFPKIVTNL